MNYEKKAKELRQEILKSLFACQSGHPGGSLSCVEILMALYYDEMKNLDPKDPKKADRDRLVLSKGHACPTLYAILADLGYFPKEDLVTLRHLGSYLQGHPDMKHIPGVDMSSGSLGQGISAAVGMAISAKLSNDDYRVYTLLGDGEIQEGQVWEASMLAGFRKLDNLVVIVDNNNLQIDAYCSARLLSDLSGGRLEDFFLGLQQNNPDYRSVWDTYLKHLAVVTNNLHMLLDYDIVLGGYVGSFLTPWLDTIRHLVAERNTFEDDGSFVKLCTYQTGAAAYGAAMDVMEEFLRTV